MRSTMMVALAVALLAHAERAGGQTEENPEAMTIAIYTPTVEFPNSAARLAYVQGLAKAVAANTGVKVEGLAFTSLASLKKANPDFAILDAQCYATSLRYRLLATGSIGGRPSRPWALFSSVGPTMQALQGKKLAFVQMGCRDKEFMENAMLDSEGGLSFFSGQVGKPDLGGAVAEVVSYKGAEAVFAPVGQQKGLTKVFDTGSVPGPAFVQVNGKLSAGVVDKVARAVIGYGGGGAISGWSDGGRQAYEALDDRFKRRVKRGLFTAPSPMRVDAKDTLIEPTTLDEVALTDVKQHFEEPPPRQ